MKITKKLLKEMIEEEMASINEQDLDEGFMDSIKGVFGGKDSDGKNLESELNDLYEELLKKINEWGLKNKDLMTQENASMLTTLQSISKSLLREIKKTRGM